MKIQYNDKTYFSTTLVNYCEYLSEILSLYKYSNSEYCSINIKNNKLIQEYKLEKRTYYNMIEILKELKIISCSNEEYIPLSTTKQYLVNYDYFYTVLSVLEQDHSITSNITRIKNRLIEIQIQNNKQDICHCYNTLQNTLYVNNLYNNKHDQLSSSAYYDLYSDPSIQDPSTQKNTCATHKRSARPLPPSGPIYNGAIFEKIKEYYKTDKCLKSIRFCVNKGRPLELCEIEEIGECMKQCCFFNPLFAKLRRGVYYLRNKGMDIQFFLNVKYKVIGHTYQFWLTGRQYNRMCKLTKEERQKELDSKGLNGRFDLHSAIFSISRFLNTGKFDADWDFKLEMGKTQYHDIYNNLLDPKALKRLYMRFFFGTKKEAYNYYQSAVKWQERAVNGSESLLPELSKEEFFQMYENYLKITKNEENNFYKDNIFLYESLLEIEVLKEFVDNGFLVSNVYDCFWFDNNQITEEKVKSKINQQTICLLNEMIA